MGSDDEQRPTEPPNPLYTRIYTDDEADLARDELDEQDDADDDPALGGRHRESRGVETRLVAAEVVGRVLDDGAYVQHALGAALRRSSLGPRDRGFATELSYGTLTWLRPIDKALERLLDRGIASVHPDLLQLLRVGAYQLGWRKQEVPDFAVIHETVDAALTLRGRGKANFVNAILRSMQRDIAIVFNPPKKAVGAPKLGHTQSTPDWIAERLIRQLGEEEATLALEAWNRATPVHVRWREGLGVASDSLTPHPAVPGAYVVDSGALQQLAELKDGRVSVQDAGAQLAGWMAPATGRALELCAGVGGKTKHLADRLGEANIIATDRDEKKLNKLRGELNGVRTLVWDAGNAPAPTPLVDGERFDHVLVDAPCSGLGSIGRHPDTRWNRGPEVVSEMAAVQTRILDAAAPMVVAGGTLLYVVCTWTDEEGPAQVQRFLGAHPDFQLEPPTAGGMMVGPDWSTLFASDGPRAGTITLWPHRTMTDGFFFARFRRAS